MRKGFLVLVIFLFSLVSLSYFTGVFSFLEALIYVKKQGRAETENTFFGNKNSNVYGGILANVNKNGVWVWGRYGLRYFRDLEESVYFSSTGCSSKNIVGSEHEYPRQFGEFVKKGDFVRVIMKNGGVFPGIEKMYGMDYWFFVNGDLTTQCRRG